MRLSVIVPTCNERDELMACLDALAEVAPDSETIVVNGPSTDGTSGAMREREDVDVLLDCSSRNINVARNAGLREATGTWFALLAPVYRVQPGWYDAIVESLSGSAQLVTGPVKVGEEDITDRGFDTSDGTRVVGGNLALTQEAVTALDGFDEYLMTGGAQDLAQRTSGQSLQVMWHPEMAVRADRPTRTHHRQHRGGYDNAWQSSDTVDWGGIYRSLAYRTVKNSGPGIGIFGRISKAALRDGSTAARDVVHGKGSPSRWVGNGISVLQNAIRGGIDGNRARKHDRTAARNPHGLSQSGDDIVVNRYVRE